MKLKSKRMTDLAVVQRVLDFWDPLGTSLCNGGSLGQIDEYDTYSFQLLNKLKLESSQPEICKFLDQIRFEFMGLKMTDEEKAENRFYSWALLQTWNCQRYEGTNIRVVDENTGFSDKPHKRKISKLEIVQQILQDWDPLEKSKHWLYGANTLNYYDEPALAVLEACENKRGLDEICLTLEVVRTSSNDKVAFLLQNWKEKSLYESKFLESLRERSTQNKWLAVNLEITFEHLGSAEERFISPSPKLDRN